MTTYQRLTAPGRGAIAVIEICGDGAIAVLNDCFTPVGKTSFANKNRGLVYGHWNSTGEDLLVVEAPTNDFAGSAETKTTRFEIQCHGSEAAVAAISGDLKSRGAIESIAAAAKPTSISGAPLSASQVRSDIEHLLSTAMTRRTAELLLHQLAIVPPAVEQIALAGEQEAIDGMLRWSDFGTRFHRRQSIVLCGRPNAGKSSLINAILGFERAIVTPIAGTTRDVLSHHTVIDGWPLELSDTAGLRAGGGQIERIGIARAKQQIENADLIVAVIDATDLAPWDEAIKPHLLVANKTDLIENGMPASSADIAKASELAGIPVVSVSAVEKTGIAELLATISKTLFPDLPPRSQPIPTTESQVEALRSLSAATR